MSSPKEPHFFSNDDTFHRGWARYEALFSGADGKVAIGEGSTGYTMQMIFPNASRRIAKHLPDAKLIYIVRNPVERIESHWRQLLGWSNSLSFDAFLRRIPDAIDASCYWRQISAYREHFPDEQILVLFFEEFVKEPDVVLKRCFEFLGVDPALGRCDPRLAVNVTKDARIDGSLIRFVRKVPGVQSLKRAAPAISKAIGAKLRRPMPDPLWPAQLRRQVIDQLRHDTASFLRHYGKPADWWQLD
jgi:hypothetical protein